MFITYSGYKIRKELVCLPSRDHLMSKDFKLRVFSIPVFSIVFHWNCKALM